MSVLIVTSLGDIVLDLYADKCPLTAKNFLKLCKIKYYNGCLFHTVQKDFTAQTGDPTGTGSGGDSVYKYLYGQQARFFSDEIHLDLKHSKIGTVAMASGGENLNASQFYFTLRDDLDYLDGKHTVFGEVAEGLETLTRINEAYVDEKNRPYKNIRIKHTYILDDPFDDPTQLTELIPDASPEGKPKDEVDDEVRLEDDWVPMDEQLSSADFQEVLRAKEAHSSAVVLESIGDIPDAEIKPPENVLFVCKLNPVTEDEDLHTIFSRFGTVISAEVIRDFKTGDSLCYAFIEFENVEACEQAYLKMDNALIDDRRIHVDFSQSVSKLWSQYRRKDNQMSKGKGCFKCGALDHIAKDCSVGGPAINQPPKYILKDDNAARGGDNNYEMVFDGNDPDSPRQRKQHGGNDTDDRAEKQKTNMPRPHDVKYRDQPKRYASDRQTHGVDRNTEDGIGRDRKTARSGRSRRDLDYLEEQRDKEKLTTERRRERGDRRDERKDYRKRSAEHDDAHEDRRGNEDYKKKRSTNDDYLEEQRDKEKLMERRRERGDRRDERTDHRKRSAEYDAREDKRSNGDYRDRKDDNRDHGKKNADSGNGGSRNELSYRKRTIDNDSDKDRREERNHRRRVTESDDDYDRRHRQYRAK